MKYKDTVNLTIHINAYYYCILSDNRREEHGCQLDNKPEC